MRAFGHNEHMRRMWFSLSILAALGLSLLVALTAPAPALALAKEKEAKIDKRLSSAVANADPDAELSVLVVGDDAAEAAGKHGQTRASLGLIDAVSARVKARDVDELASEDGVSFLAADVPLRPTGAVDPARLLTLYPKVDGAPAAWARNLDGHDVGIALIDSGIKRVDLDGVQYVDLPDLGPRDDKYGHGSLVAGVLAGRRKDSKYAGIAPDAMIYSLNVNTPEGPRSSSVIKALEWVFQNARAKNIRVVNLSLQETVAGSYQQSLLDLAVERLWAAGVVVVAAAGNGGTGAVDFAPANDPLVLTVGATDNNDTLVTSDDRVASFSAGGLTGDSFAKPELLAPGRHIVSTLPKDLPLWQLAPVANRAEDNYVSVSGTSFAAPQVAGAAAILFQQHPGWSPDQIKWLLTSTSQPVAGSSAGALRLGAAVAYAGQPASANQGVAALVCAPGSPCIVGGTVGTVSSSWSSSSWNSSSWNSSSWNSSSWNSASWNSSSWNSSSWNSSSWNSSSWNSFSWNTFGWD